VKLQNSASEFEDSYSEFAVYNSSGRLLQGSERFKETWEYSELAKQLDIKRSALYAEFRGHELLLGCSLLVKIRKGREERVVFIEYLPKEAVTEAPGWINKLYADAKSRTEGLQSIRYQVIGLWKEGDIFDLSIPKSPKSSKNSKNPKDLKSLKNSASAGNFPDYLERKVLSREGVSILTPDLSSGLFLLAGLIFKLKAVLFPDFSLALSLYPSKTDISVGPGEFDPDFTFEGGEIRISAANNKKENPEEKNEITERIQEEGLKEYENIYNYNHFNSDHPVGSASSKIQEASSKKNKIWQKKKVAGYTCCFFLFLMAGILVLSKAGLEPGFISFNISKNNGTDFPPFRAQLETREDINSQTQDLRNENTSKMQLPIPSFPGDGSSNRFSVNPVERAQNRSHKPKDLVKEINNSSEVGNEVAGSSAGAGNDAARNESTGNGTLESQNAENQNVENQNIETGIPKNEGNGYGIPENKSLENDILENKSIGNKVLENKSIGNKVLENGSSCNEAIKL
jgi:hypothetical protein